MDTATHIVMGIGLAGFATLDPVIASDPMTFHAVAFGAVIGSVIPDIDTVLKFKNNATYIRHHRGVTHSLPFTALWPFILTLVISSFYPQINAAHLFYWTLLAVGLHVFVDIFNAYGTQAVRPLSSRWLALGIINIFDPFIFSVHVMGFIIWLSFGHPGVTFATIYAVLGIYYLLRTWQHHRTLSEVRKQLPGLVKVYLSPTMRWSHYHIAAESPNRFYVGKMDGRKLHLIDSFKRSPIEQDNALLKMAMKDKNVRAFLSFSPIYHWSISQRKGMYVIQFTDLRYFSKGIYTFTATVWTGGESVMSSYTGWVFSEQKLRKKLVLAQSK
ncbi:MAG: metal-dependent hydrolase [Sporolactobacillus sp.]